MQYFYKQLEYFQKFRCIGGECPANCCDEPWAIFWKRKEVDHLLEADMSDELREQIKEHIVPDASDSKNNRYIISATDEKRCPFHNKESGLCDIQRELGEEYLCHTCVNYPRRFFKIDSNIIRFCAASCPAVLKLLMHDKKAATIETIPVRECSYEAIAYDPPERLERLPYLKYRMEIVDLYSYIFSSKLSFDTAMLVGPICAKKISESSEKDKGMMIPALMGMVKDMCSGNEPERLADNVTPNYSSRLNIGKSLMLELSQYSVDISVLCDENGIAPEKYLEGKKKFFSEIHNPDTALKNIAMNVFLDRFCGSYFRERSFFSYFSYFVICMSTICLLGYAAAYIGDDIEKKFIECVSILDRKTLHTVPTSVFDSLEENGICEPEHLASLIK